MSTLVPDAVLDRPAQESWRERHGARSTAWLAVPAVLLTALTAGYLATSDTRLALVLGGCLLGAVYLTGAPHLGVAVTAFFVLLFLPRSFVSTTDLTDDLLRTVAVFLLVPFALLPLPPRPATPMTFAGLHGLGYLVAGYVIYVSASTLPHQRFTELAIHASATVMILIALRALTSDGGSSVARVCPSVFGALMAVSLGMGLLMPAVAFRQERLRAFMVNPNTLGAYAFLAFMIAVVLVHNGVVSGLLAFVSLAVIWWSGSRASALGALAGLLILAASGMSRSRRLIATIGAVIIGLSVLTDVALFDGALFREANTRDASWNEALRVLDSAPLVGWGIAQETVEVASSPLRALVHGGAVGLFGVLVMYGALVIATLRVRGPLVALTVAGIVHSLAEGWFLSAVSPMLLVYLAVWIAFRHESVGGLECQVRIEVAHAH